MSAPDKIYLQIGDDVNEEEIPDDNWYTNQITWCADNIFDSDIEYVRSTRQWNTDLKILSLPKIGTWVLVLLKSNITHKYNIGIGIVGTHEIEIDVWGCKIVAWANMPQVSDFDKMW